MAAEKNMISIDTECPMCGSAKVITVPFDHYNRWTHGTLIQDAFPYLDDADRERIKTGICNDCWNNMFSSDEDEEDDDYDDDYDE